jgi:hypothetical protein
VTGLLRVVTQVEGQVLDFAFPPLQLRLSEYGMEEAQNLKTGMLFVRWMIDTESFLGSSAAFLNLNLP